MILGLGVKMMGISIRELRMTDYQRLIEIWKKAGLPFRPNGRDRREEIQKQIESGLVRILGAFKGEELIGVVMINHDGRKGWINRLAVIPEMRKMGVATRLIEESEKILIGNGFEVIGVLVESDRPDSKELFLKQGYVEETEISYLTKRLRKDA